MAIEDFETFTEVDSGDDITVTPSKIDVVGMDKAAISYVYRDYGIDHFDDFEHLLNIYMSSNSIGFIGGCWMVSDQPLTHEDAKAANEGIGVFFYRSGGSYRIYAWDYTDDDSEYYTGAVSTPYYLTIERSGTTFTVKIYSDSDRTDLLATLPLTVTSVAYSHVTGVYSHDA